MSSIANSTNLELVKQEKENESENLNNLLNYIIIQKSNENILKRIIIYAVVILIVLLYFYLLVYLISSTSCSVILAKYENIAKQSDFSNKDQYIDPNVDNYDIHYLVEQMIYKEFSPSDKKKYLNLPEALNDKLIIDYLIAKI